MVERNHVPRSELSQQSLEYVKVGPQPPGIQFLERASAIGQRAVGITRAVVHNSRYAWAELTFNSGFELKPRQARIFEQGPVSLEDALGLEPREDGEHCIS